ncbi:putative polyketide synthase [Hypoxylon sp. FL0543]|nr:putative polyketide synthase [Hypoxylon sp. FL0543]
MSSRTNEPIAIVGSACRFAGSVSSPSKLWELLRDPVDLLREIPVSRFNADSFYHADGKYHGHSDVKHAYLLDDEMDLSAFDAEFFGVKPAEAKSMDPQQRFLLEVVYEAIEAAGYSIACLAGSDTAVYVGSMFDDYATMILRDIEDIPTYFATGTGRSLLSNRISYFFDWHGPSVSLDTACSSSLVAVHTAVQSLRAGESRVALACGTNLILSPENFIVESKLSMLSPDGRSRMWDQGANGYARGDGVAALVLKTLSSALEDGDDIECIIRETGVNQDGATQGIHVVCYSSLRTRSRLFAYTPRFSGITVPSAAAQEELIRRVYERAGLNLKHTHDRPQFFEAHGTGTQAGDPVEAEAVYRVFGSLGTEDGVDRPLLVGSIKTVFGHTEGTAGVAAILKASLALQHASIPANLLFEHVSNRVAPFYKNIEVPRFTQPWPYVAGGKRRASVNSFGFGGTNAHAVLENYDAARVQDQVAAADHGKALFTPFVFSAFSQLSLETGLRKFLEFLEENGTNIDLGNLAWTLRKRRSIFAWRTSITSSCEEELRRKLRARLEHSTGSSAPVRPMPTAKTRLLGIFTGQGAQYVRMGAELIERSGTARGIIRQLDAYLSQIPHGEAPAWSLEAELLAEEDASHVYEAAFSQPLYTAIQILIVDLLKIAGVYFDAVVGHSSGEIAAAYTAERLTARDAIIIAYFRGLHLHHSTGHIRGAMMAVETTPEDAAELIADRVFNGRLSLAAVNSPSNVTISGDEDAISELSVILEDEEVSYRRLRVDKAYHSLHMLPYFEPYVASLRRCGVASRKPSANFVCAWHSSVFEKPATSEMDGLGDTYWAENLTRPVLFSQALGRALTENACNLVLEIGPHPSLKGPASHTIQDVLEKDLPYSGTFHRGTGAVEAMSSALGFLWSHLGHSRISLDSYEQAMNHNSLQFRLVKNLPPYSWNHETKYWHEPRSSRKTRRRPDAVNPLLGHTTPDSALHCMSWRHLIRVGEMKWLSGHQVQNQVVFPAAGYICTAVEAARFLVDSTWPGQSIRLIEIRDFVISQPIVFSDSYESIEVLITMADINSQHPNKVGARFTYAAALASHHTNDLTLTARCDINIVLGHPDPSVLPARKPMLPHMIDVETDRFYSSLADLGYGFRDRFRSLSGLRRKHGTASCLVTPGENDGLLLHPAELDAALQSIILAYSYPYDEHLRTLHIPTTIQCIRINPCLFLPSSPELTNIHPVDSSVPPQKAGQKDIVGHANLYTNTASHAAIQVQGASFMPLGGATRREDRRLFSQEQWIPSKPDGIEAARDIAITDSHLETVQILERMAVFYLAKFDRELAADHPKRFEFPTSCYLRFARHTTALVESGMHRRAKREWLNDTLESLMEASKPLAHLPDVEIMHLVGSRMPRVFRGETTMLEEFRANGSDILDRCYADAFGLKESSRWVRRSVKQLTERYTHMNILEVGAGTGGATTAVLREIGQNFRSYTYTDISAAFFDKAASSFSQFKDQMIFKTLNVEKNPLEQGYSEGAYDLVIAFFVIHATSDLSRSLRHIRKLVKPGGFLVVGEGQDVGKECTARSGLIFGTLPGWWLGADTGRALSPHASPAEWDELLRSTGWSGIDTSPPTSFTEMFDVFHFVSQAVDDRITFLREPLLYETPSSLHRMKKLAIVGGLTATTTDLVKGLEVVLLNREGGPQIRSFQTLPDVDYAFIDADCAVVSLTELDAPIFKNITEKGFMALKQMFETAKALLWITSGRLADEPFSNMTVGFGRTAASEMPDLRLQQLEIVEPSSVTAESLAEVLLRFYAISEVQGLLWSLEPEVVIDSGQRQLLSRLRDIPELNDRHNSARRPITRILPVEESSSRISAQFDSGQCALVQLPSHEDLAPDSGGNKDLIELRITHSSLSAVNTPAGLRFVVIGNEAITGTPRIALSSSLVSPVKIPAQSTISCPDFGLARGQLVPLLFAYVVVRQIIRFLEYGQTLIAHNTPTIIAAVLEIEAVDKGVNVIYSVNDSTAGAPASWIRLSRYVSQSDANDILEAIKPSCFVSFSEDGSQISADEETLRATIRHHCRIFLSKEMLYHTPSSATSGDSPASLSTIGELLHSALQCSQRLSLGVEASTSVQWAKLLPLDQITGTIDPQESLSVIDWTSVNPVPVQVTRLDSIPLFKSTGSTYWIVGMTRALGISLADWMVSKGAANLVMTSRKPEISSEWIKAHRQRGVRICVLPCDVTDGDALRAVHEEIRTRLPPVQGVIHGAMVLRDTSIKNMSFGELTDVVRPKVNGGINLDRQFYDTDLDFLVFVSSVNCVIGNIGQANYAAANTFLCSLAAQRRKRGLRAATANIGAIIGAGYLERESRRELDAIVERLNLLRLSEEDWHQSICEAIDACRLASPYGPELTAGLAEVPSDMSLAPQWYSNPRFSSFLITKAALKGEADVKAVVTVEELLRQCRSKEDIWQVVQSAFSAQLRTILQVSTSDKDLMGLRGGELGLDSLVSVDIRSWSLQHLQVNIPILKITGNGTIESLVEYLVENLRPDLTPGLVDSSAGAYGRQATTDSSDRSTVEDTLTEEISSTSSTSPNTDFVNGLGAEAGSGDEGKIDWEAESRPVADVFDGITTTNQLPARYPPRVVVLTGSTGLLGRHLLSHLLAEPTVQKVLCLAIRSLRTRLQHGKLLQDPRVVYYNGDLAQPLLGLSEQEVSSIFGEADVVIHNGSDTSHLKHYVDLRRPNVESTALLCRLCVPRRIPLHYVSSAGLSIFHEKSATEGFPAEPARLAPGWVPDGSFGYMCGKWVCERLLERTSQVHGLRVCIHRPSAIIREGDDAVGKEAEKDWVNAFLAFVRKLKTAPKIVSNHGSLDLVYVKSVCESIVEKVFENTSEQEGLVTYVNEVGDKLVPLDKLQDMGLEEHPGTPFPLVPLQEWVTKAVSAGLHPGVAALISEMADGGMEYPKLLKGDNSFRA